MKVLSWLLRISLLKSLIDLIFIIASTISIDFNLKYIISNEIIIYEKSKAIDSFVKLLNKY